MPGASRSGADEAAVAWEAPGCLSGGCRGGRSTQASSSSPFRYAPQELQNSLLGGLLAPQTGHTTGFASCSSISI